MHIKNSLEVKPLKHYPLFVCTHVHRLKINLTERKYFWWGETTMMLSTDQAVSYLKKEHGYTTTKSSLETLRCRGGGSVYLKIKGKVYYTDTQLTEWVIGNTGMFNNTSEYPLDDRHKKTPESSELNGG